MKIKMHYLFGKKQKVACGNKNVLTTTNYREITCRKCLKTHAHRNTISGAAGVVNLRTP
jgi:hypothetical protein